ncbi:hypothetical protein D9M71_604090 [compost metagenome]
MPLVCLAEGNSANRRELAKEKQLGHGTSRGDVAGSSVRRDTTWMDIGGLLVAVYVHRITTSRVAVLEVISGSENRHDLSGVFHLVADPSSTSQTVAIALRAARQGRLRLNHLDFSSMLKS